VADIHSSRQTSANQENDNPLLSSGIKLPKFEERITTRWQRFSSGLWRVPEGDITAAYCGDQFPRLKTFVHSDQLYTNMGMAFLGGGVDATCHPLLPSGTVDIGTKPYSSEGKVGTFRGKSWMLGPKVIFVSEDPPVADWQKILRAQYADGGYFASQPSYAEFLLSLAGKKTENEKIAFKCEQKGQLLKFSKAEMSELLDSAPNKPQSGAQQLPLF
jgi:hypothetical protein